MSEDQDIETTETEATEAEAKSPKGRVQVPAQLPSEMREFMTKHEGAIAQRPGFRNPGNAKSKAQKGGKKGKKK